MTSRNRVFKSEWLSELTKMNETQNADSNSKAREEQSLSGKIAIVTGASQGIGRTIALELARQGAELVITARNQSKLNDLATAIRQLGTRAQAIAGDLRESEFANHVVATAAQAFGRIDVVVNSAGATKRGNFLEL